MFTLQIAFSTQEELQDFVARLGGEPAQGIEPAAATNKPAPRRRSKKDDAKPAETAPAAPAAGGAAADPLAGLMAPQAPVMTPPAAEAPQAAPAPAAAPPAAPAATQAQLIAAATELGKTKGRDALAQVTAHFGVQAIAGPTGIPEARWGEAIALIQKALAS